MQIITNWNNTSETVMESSTRARFITMTISVAKYNVNFTDFKNVKIFFLLSNKINFTCA